jgi:steroid 5-alpha reductase family enzyme
MDLHDLLRDALAAVPSEAGWMLALALAISALGFLRVVWFVSLGYAGSVAAIALLSTWMFRDALTPWSALHAALLLIYGLRLGSYLVRREVLPAYAPAREDAKQRGAKVKAAVKPAIWVSVALLYVLMTAPLLLVLVDARAAAPAGPPIPQLIGLGIAALGLGTEAVADHQKSSYKANNPKRWCDVGLYRFVRCPNYLGEMIFWLGSWVAGLSAYHHGLHWLATGVGLICIQLIMMGSTKRLEAGQLERYGHHEAYQRYIDTVPVLFPFVPVYTLADVRVYLE